MNLHKVFEIHMQKHGTKCNALIGLKYNILRGRKEFPVRRNSCDAMKICMSTDVHVYLLIKRGQPGGQPLCYGVSFSFPQPWPALPVQEEQAYLLHGHSSSGKRAHQPVRRDCSCTGSCQCLSPYGISLKPVCCATFPVHYICNIKSYFKHFFCVCQAVQKSRYQFQRQ